jgi:hypothetical protein
MKTQTLPTRAAPTPILWNGVAWGIVECLSKWHDEAGIILSIPGFVLFRCANIFKRFERYHSQSESVFKRGICETAWISIQFRGDVLSK